MKLIYFPGFMDDARDLRALDLNVSLDQGESLQIHIADVSPHLRRRSSREEVSSAWSEQLRRERADLVVAYSMGARLAADVLQLAPEIASQALLLSPHPGLRSEADRQSRRQQDRAWAMRFRSAACDKAWRQLGRAWNSQAVLRSREPRFGQWDQRFRYARELELLGLASQGDHRAWYQRARGIKVLIGERDAKFRELWKGLPHEVVPEAGHRLLVDAPSSVRKFCLEILRS